MRKIKERVRDFQLQKAKQNLLMQTSFSRQPLQHVKEGKIHQQLNHFNRQDVSTFPQVESEQSSKYDTDLFSVSARSEA